MTVELSSTHEVAYLDKLVGYWKVMNRIKPVRHGLLSGKRMKGKGHG